MIDTRTLEVILSEQKEELEARTQETLCHRPEEALVEINSPQARVEGLGSCCTNDRVQGLTSADRPHVRRYCT